MPKRKTILQATFPYHLTARSINRELFLLDKKTLWQIFCDYLFVIKHEFKTQIHAFVLMDNHFHLIMSTPYANLSECMNYFMREVSREVSRENDRINQTFGGPYHWCILDSYSYYLNTYKYVYRNPVVAKMVECCEDYEESTLFGLLGRAKLQIPLEEDTVLFNGKTVDNLKWLNEARPEHSLEIKKSLKKKYFRFQRDRITCQPVLPDNFIF